MRWVFFKAQVVNEKTKKEKQSTNSSTLVSGTTHLWANMIRWYVNENPPREARLYAHFKEYYLTRWNHTRKIPFLSMYLLFTNGKNLLRRFYLRRCKYHSGPTPTYSKKVTRKGKKNFLVGSWGLSVWDYCVVLHIVLFASLLIYVENIRMIYNDIIW